MNLIYRGQPYIPSHKPASVDPQTTFTYRGQSYRRSGSVAIMPKTNLVYRGVPYVQNHESTLIGTYTPAFN